MSSSKLNRRMFCSSVAGLASAMALPNIGPLLPINDDDLFDELAKTGLIENRTMMLSRTHWVYNHLTIRDCHLCGEFSVRGDSVDFANVVFSYKMLTLTLPRSKNA